MESSIKLPSRFQRGDYCYLQMQEHHYAHSTIVGVKFTKTKVLYDLDVQVVPFHSDSHEEVKHSTTRFHGIDSELVISTDEYDEIKRLNRLKIYDGRDLVTYGQYLLSDERKRRRSIGAIPSLLEDGLKQVSHADTEEWMDIYKRDFEELTTGSTIYPSKDAVQTVLPNKEDILVRLGQYILESGEDNHSSRKEMMMKERGELLKLIQLL